MLRVDIHETENVLSLKLEGRFTGNDAENTCTLMARCDDGKTLVVDLTELTFIDSMGEEVLSSFGRFGAEFVAQTSYTIDTCERLRLRLAPSQSPDGDRSGASRTNSRPRRALARRPANEEV